MHLDAAETGQFDKIACVSVLEHVPRTELAEWFAKFRAVVRDGGLVAITAESHPDREINFPGGDRSFQDAQLLRMIEGTGLAVVEKQVCPVYCENSTLGWRPLAVRLSAE